MAGGRIRLETVCAQRYGFRRCHVRPSDAARTIRPRTSVLRNSGHPRSKPLELPLLGHRARSCRSRRCAAIAPRTTADPASSTLRVPVGDARHPCHIKGADPLALPSRTAGFPSEPARVRARPARPARSPRTACVTFHASGFAAHPDDAERGAESFPLSLRRSGGRPPPTCLQAPSPVAGGHAVSGVLTLTESLRRTSFP